LNAQQFVPLENPDGQQELIPEAGRREGGGDQKPWIIPVSSRADFADRGTRAADGFAAVLRPGRKRFCVKTSTA